MLLLPNGGKMNRVNVLNDLIQKNNYKSYLEIGVDTGWLFEQISCNKKAGVDPNKIYDNLTFNMTSDEFFLQNNDKFDIIFIDGLHLHEQVYKDFKNSLACLNDGGLILFHDCNPTVKEWQLRDWTVAEWTGDCWKALIKIRQEYDFYTCVIDCDYGIGVCNPFRQAHKLQNIDVDLTYENLNIYRNQWLNLKPLEEFKHEFGL